MVVDTTVKDFLEVSAPIIGSLIGFTNVASVQSVAPIQFSGSQHRFTQLSQARDLRSSIGNITLNPIDLFAELFLAIR